MTIHLTRKIDIQDPSWDFRFMLNRDVATDDFIRYFPQFNPTHESWRWDFDMKKPHKMQRLGSLWALFTPEKRLFFLQGFINKLEKECGYSKKIGIEILNSCMNEDFSSEEKKLILPALLCTEGDAAMHALFKWLRMADVDILSWVESFVPTCEGVHSEMASVVYSFLLCTGDPVTKERVKNTIIASGYEDALMVVRYATSAGWLKNVEDDKARLIQQFRNGESSKNMLSAFKKYQKNIIESIRPDDTVFLNVNHETFPYAIQFLNVHYSDNAVTLCDNALSQKKHLQLRDIVPYGHVGFRTAAFIRVMNEGNFSGETLLQLLPYLKNMPYRTIERIAHDLSAVKILKYFWMLTRQKVCLCPSLSRNEQDILKKWCLKKAPKEWERLMNNEHFNTNSHVLGFSDALKTSVEQNSTIEVDECEIML